MIIFSLLSTVSWSTSCFFFLIFHRDPYCHFRPACFARFDLRRTGTHHFQALPDIFNRDVLFLIYRENKSRSAILHNDFILFLCFTDQDRNIERIKIRIQPVLDRVFHDRLEGQGRNEEKRILGIELYKQLSGKPCLLYLKVGLCVLQLLRERNHPLFRNRLSPVICQPFPAAVHCFAVV